MDQSITKLVEDAGGKIDEGSVMALPDGSGCFTASWPLPKDHWVYEPAGEPPAQDTAAGSFTIRPACPSFSGGIGVRPGHPMDQSGRATGEDTATGVSRKVCPYVW